MAAIGATRRGMAGRDTARLSKFRRGEASQGKVIY